MKKEGKKKDKKKESAVPAAIPDFAVQRLKLWEQLKADYLRDLEGKARTPIKITLPDGKVLDGKAWETSPLSVANELSKSLAKQVIVAKVNDQLWDLARPLEEDCKLALLKWDDAEAKDVFWHSSAHVLGQALERIYQGFLCTGPPIQGGGFFYDMSMEGKTVSPNDFPTLQEVVDQVVREKQPFEVLRVPKDRALEMFQYSPFKREILSNKVPEADSEGVGAMCTVYRCGNLVDLCRGPHIPDTGRIGGFQVWKSSSSYWKGDSNNAALQRVYGISFPEKKLLEEWQKQQAALEAKSHVAIGSKQQLFFVEPQYSPGSTFWLPHGARIYNKLIQFLRGEYQHFGFTEVVTPNLFNNDLWLTSGHFPKYEKDMFTLDVDKQRWALKPMNCFPVEDHQLLTSKGFLFHEEVVAHMEQDPEFRLASYDPDRKAIVYERPQRIVHNAVAGQKMVQFSHASAGFAATSDHNLFTRSAGSHDEYALAQAGDIVSSLGQQGAVEFLAFAEAGVQGTSSSFAEELQLNNEAQINAFLRIASVWMADGFVAQQKKEIAFPLSDSLKQELNAVGLVEGSDWHVDSSSIRVSAPRFVSFFIRQERCWSGFSRDQCRKVLAGLLADGQVKQNFEIQTCSVQFRDELVQLGLHAGYSVHFVCDDDSLFSVKFSLSKAQPVVRAADVRVAHSEGATWCATMPSGFVVVRRAEVNEIGVVKAASRPTIQGNCPGHCVMFKHLPRSHRELPIRFADFGVLHRNEESGALKGLTRVRRFQQDDAHIFCKEEDIMGEIQNQLQFMKKVYGIFGYEFSLELSTRPDNYLGDIAVWEKAEAALEAALQQFGHPYGKDIGGGAFYGPKEFDVKIKDSLGRQHQCATVQLDFQLPIRFGLEYIGKEKNEVLRPVIIHRAIYGSLERFIGILIEHLEGKWPLWLSPRQCMVISVSKKFNDYAEVVKNQLSEAGFYADIDLSGKTLDKKILEHSLYNYILVVGATEEANKSVNVRKRKESEEEVQVGREREVPVLDFIAELTKEVKEFK